MKGAGNFAVYQDNDNIYCKRWDAVNRSWAAAETLDLDTLASRYPSLDVEQFVDGTDSLFLARFALWTEKIDSVSYTPAGELRNYDTQSEVGVSPYAYMKMGRPAPPPFFTVRRTGRKVFGAEEYKTIDYATDSLVYVLPHMENGREYRLFLECYFDTVSPPSPWAVLLRIVGTVSSLGDTILLNKGSLYQNTTFIGTSTSDTLRIILKNINPGSAGYAPCSRIIISSFVEDSLTFARGNVGERGGQTGLLRPPCLHAVAPNPAARGVSVRYEVFGPTRIKLTLYDVAGRAVRTLRKGELLPGTYDASWDARDDQGRRAPNGVYFCRLAAENIDGTGPVADVKKCVLLGR